MSQTKKRVVFSHRLDGQDRQLFVVHEKTDKSLIIIVKDEDNLSKPSKNGEIFVRKPNFRALTTSHISIHNSDESSGMLIKYTNELSGKSEETHACFISDAKDRLLHPIFFKLYPDLSNSKYNIKKNYEVKIVVGESSRQDCATVCIAALVCDYEQPLPLLGWNSLSTMDFKRYRIAVYYCFLNVLPDRDGSTLFTCTEKGGQGDGGVNSANLKALELILLDNFKLLSAAKVEQQAADATLEMAIKLRSHPLYFHPNVADLRNGREQRAENIV